MDYLIYLAKVSAIMLVLYTIFYFLLRKTTFFRWNRLYLLMVLAISFIIPFISAPQWNFSNGVKTDFAQQTNEIYITKITAEGNIGQYPINEAGYFTWETFMLLIYGLGVSVILGIFIYNVYKLIKLGQKGAKDGRYRMVQSDGLVSNSSFFNIIFLNDTELSPFAKTQIIAHEKAHSHFLHSLDIILVELVKSILWFNPLIYFYKKSLQQIHEYEVDAYVTQVNNKKEYAYLLLNLQTQQSKGLTHAFSKKPLSDRIFMLFTNPSGKMKKLLYLLIIPVIAFSCEFLGEKELKENSNPQIIMRTIEGTEKLGKNPIVMINGLMYQADILSKIDPDIVKITRIVAPENITKEHIDQYGKEAKDGLVEIDVFGKFYPIEIDNRYVVENILKEQSIPKNQFLGKVTIKMKDGSEKDLIVIKVKKNFIVKAEVSKGNSPKFFIDDKEYNLTDFEETVKANRRNIVRYSSVNEGLELEGGMMSTGEIRLYTTL